MVCLSWLAKLVNLAQSPMADSMSLSPVRAMAEHDRERPYLLRQSQKLNDMSAGILKGRSEPDAMTFFAIGIQRTPATELFNAVTEEPIP